MCVLQYSWKCLLVQNFAEITSRLFRKKFSWLLFPWNDYVMLCMTTPHVQAELVTLNNEAKKQACATMASLPLCVEALKIMKASGLLSWGRSWLVEQKNSALPISTLTISEHLLRIHLYSSRLILRSLQ